SRCETIVHGRADLALHCLREGRDRHEDATPLLMLHGLAEHIPTTAPAYLDAWPGAVYGVDFTGHGLSTIPSAGGYTAEILLADADTALRRLGAATVIGRGL